MQFTTIIEGALLKSIKYHSKNPGADYMIQAKFMVIFSLILRISTVLPAST